MMDPDTYFGTTLLGGDTALSASEAEGAALRAVVVVERLEGGCILYRLAVPKETDDGRHGTPPVHPGHAA